MQKDTESTSGNMTHHQAASKDPQILSFQCSHCVLIFKSKLFLLEHLNIVHGFNVDAALTNAGLRSSKINKVLAGDSGDDTDNTEDEFVCQHCDFKACSLDSVIEHEGQCHKDVPQKGKGISESPETETGSSLKETTNQQNEEMETDVPSCSDTSTSKTKCTTTSSMKKYTKPQQNITKYLVITPGSNVKPSKSDGGNGIIILRDPRLNSSVNSDGVLKVAASSKIDIAGNGTGKFLQQDQLFYTNWSSSTSDNTGKRTRNDILTIPAKKAKMDEGDTDLARNKPSQPSSSSQFLFDVSEDEEERKGDLVNNDADDSIVYFCKHCDYNGVDLNRASLHYHKVHPYIRYTFKYIQDPDDQSATFRCLECPVEFVTVAKLKKHYTENHPEAPDVFAMQSHEYSLGFKCFFCSFTTDVLKALKEHHQKSHPTLTVDNPLMCCRYSVSKCREGPSQLFKSEETSSPKTSSRIPPTSCEEVKHTPSPQRLASKGADAAMYQCHVCKFGHSSVIVMYVHYQKFHPEQTVTIDQIKQSAQTNKIKHSCTKLQMTPEKIPVSVTVTGKSQDSPPKNVLDSPMTMNKPELSQQKNISFINPEHGGETPHCQSETSKTKDGISARTKGKAKKSSNSGEWKRSTVMDTSSEGLEVFYCLFCSYSSHNVKSVIGHHNAKHFEYALISTLEILRHSAEVQKGKRQGKAEASVSSTPSESGSHKQVEVCFDKGSQREDEETAALSSNPYGRAENLYFCQKCNFANLSVKGVLNHQSKIHRNLMSSTDRVVRYTALIREKMAKSKCGRLPLPIINSGDEEKFFCHLCNFRQKSVTDVLFHYSKRHREFEANAVKVEEYTSMVHEQTTKLHLNANADEMDNHASLGEREDEKTQMEGELSLSSSIGAPQNRSLRCYKCSYSVPHVYLLRKHLRKIHKINRSFGDVLRMCFRQGTLPSGYHCDKCVFSHEEAAAVHLHYQDQHPGRKVTLQYVTAQLYAGMKASPHKKKKGYTERTGDVDDRIQCRRAGQDEGKIFPCRACSFKGSSLQAITNHYRAVHPWSVKEDGSVLDVITSCQVESHTELSHSLDTDQVPVKFEMSTAASSHETAVSPTVYKCLYCSAGFQSQVGLSTHCRLKHREPQAEGSGDQPAEMDTGEQGKYVRVLKCPHCTYVNTGHTGVVTHCQMKHPALPAAAGLEMKEVLLSDGDEHVITGPNDELKWSGYLCELCPAILASPKKLQKHCEHEHSLTVPNMLEAACNYSAVTKDLSRYPSTQGSVLQDAIFKKKKHAAVRCPYCSFVCKTKIVLRQHFSIHHKNESELKVDVGLYTCVLCSFSSSKPRYLGSHYTQKHGEAAFLEHYAPVFWQMCKNTKATSLKYTVTEQTEDAPETCDPSTAAVGEKALIYKCPSCTYVNASYHGTLTHCQMIHPTVTARADELQTEEILLANVIGCWKRKGGKLIFGGYMCKMCPLIHPSPRMMKIHSERDHGQTVSNMHQKPAVKVSSRLKKQLLSKYRSTPSSILQAGFFKNKKYAKLYCEYCKYTSSTKIALDRHMRIHHKTESGAEDQVFTYKCAQCPYSSLVKKYLRTHFTVRHGKTAPFKYYVQENVENNKMPKPTNTLRVEIKESPYKCRLCMYSSSCRRYLSGHYKRVHRLDAQHPIRQQQVMEWGGHKTEIKAESMESGSCIKCPNLFFDSPQLLSAHYSNFHSSDFRSDFTVLKHTSKKGAYKCGHCDVKIKGVRKLGYHLNLHREINMRKAAMVKAPLVSELTGHDVPPEPEAVKSPVTEGAASPPSLPLKCTDSEKPELTAGQKGFTCKLCARTFMSVLGLRVHERSHAATDALQNLETLSSPSSRQIFNKFIIIKSGNVKPFHCSMCPYRTNVMGLWRNHFMKNHGEIFMNPAEVDNQEEMVHVAEKESVHPNYYNQNYNTTIGYSTQPDEEYERPFYLEPPDVQRQLDHYNLMAQANASSKAKLQQAELPEDCLLYCDLCSFTTEYLSSIRRHYLNRHGKKLLRCKGCSFVTGSRKNLETHIERGHSDLKAEPTRQKVLRCPLCLYQTKTKNNMIDHIVLHREERVVPIEVRRPKLSRYLRGIVFRCHKCTFASASDENLRLHMMKHDDIRPYKCRLCYFDCTTLSDLEAHLCDKHQVMRNHELVGQINLDQQEERLFAMSDTEANIQIQQLEGKLEGNEKDKIPNLKNELHCLDGSDVSPQTQPKDLEENDIKQSTAEPNEDPHQKLGKMSLEENAETNGKCSASVPQHENNVKPNSVVQQERVQNRAQIDPLSGATAKGLGIENEVKPTLQQGGKANCKLEADEANRKGRKDPKKERDTDENQAQPKTRDGEPGMIKHKKDATPHGRKFKIEQNIDTKVEDDILRHILLLDEDGGISSIPKKWSEVKTEVLPTSVNKNHMTTTVRERLTATHNCEQVDHKQPSDEMSSGVVLTNRKEGQAPCYQNHNAEPADPYGEMPVLENEYLKEEVQPAGWYQKDEDCKNLEQRQQTADEAIHKDGNNPCKDRESEDGEKVKEVNTQAVNKGAFAALDIVAGVPRQPVNDETLFTCELCGRSLMNRSQLECHIMRHGM